MKELELYRYMHNNSDDVRDLSKFLISAEGSISHKAGKVVVHFEYLPVYFIEPLYEGRIKHDFEDLAEQVIQYFTEHKDKL